MIVREAGDYCWIRIRILGPQDEKGCYRVEAELDDGSWHRHEMRLNDDDEQELVRRSIEGADSYGQYLYDRLFPEELDRAFQQSLGRARNSEDKQLRVQLWISEECSELHRFRWERLYTKTSSASAGDTSVPSKPLALWELTPFSRFTRLPIPEPQLDRSDRPLRVLMAVANPENLPDDLTEVDVRNEIINFCGAMKDVGDIIVTILPGRSGFKFDDLPEELKLEKFNFKGGSTTINRVQEELLKHHALHFVGHGVFEKGAIKQESAADSTSAVNGASAPAPAVTATVAAAVITEAGKTPESTPTATIVAAEVTGAAAEAPRPKRDNKRATFLLLENETGQLVKVRDRDIVANLAQRDETKLPRLIFLAACDTSKYDERDPRPYTSLGPKLVEAGFPAVVAMQDKLPMDVEKVLTKNFYTNLMQNGVIDLALNQSRWFLYENSEDLKADWTIPVLFMRTPRGRLFTVNHVRVALRAMTEAPQFRQPWRYDYLPLEAVMLVGDQIKSNWENSVLPAQGWVDFYGQMNALLEQRDEGEPVFLAVTGQRGTARSTALKWQVLKTAKKSLDGDSLNQVLPVYVDLSKQVLTSGTVPPFLTLLAQGLNEFWPGAMNEKKLDEMLRDNSVKLQAIFDQGDDLSESQRRALLNEIREFNAKYPQHPCVMAMTRGLWNWERSGVTHVLDVQPLSRRRIIRYLFDCTMLEERRRVEKQQAESSAQGSSQPSAEETALIELRRSLEETQLFDLAAMPWMFVQLIKESLDGDYPQSRVGVLRNLIEEKISFITSWRGQQARALETLYALAHRMQMTNEPTLSIKDALTIMEGVRENREYALEEMLDSLMEQDLLARSGGDAVRFMYPAYQAYCCAQALHDRSNARLWEDITAGLGRISHLRRWDDTLTLLSGLVEEPEDLLEKIAYATSLKDGEQIFLAARCLLEARMNGTEREGQKPGYVESLILDALVWRSDSVNEPRSFQRLRAVEALGRLKRLEVVGYLTRIAMTKMRTNSMGKIDFEYGSIRQSAGRALRRLLPKEKTEPEDKFTAELRRLCPPLEDLIQKWIRGGPEEMEALEQIMKAPNQATDEAQKTCNDALASMAAFALGDLRSEKSHERLIVAFLDDDTPEVIRWAITDALALLDPDKVMKRAILKLIDSGKLNDPEELGERREQLIYLIGQLRQLEPKALAFLDGVLRSPNVPTIQKGRAILALGALHPPNWRELKANFEDVALGDFTSIAMDIDKKSEQGMSLRIKALQALAEIGDQQTLEKLRQERGQWTPELERIFYSTSEEIIWRNNC